LGGAGRQRSLATTLARSNRDEEAESEYRAALAMYCKLAEENPAVPQFRADLAKLHNDLGFALLGSHHYREAEVEFRQALATWSELARADTTLTESRRGLFIAESGLGDLAFQSRAWAEARDHFERALALVESMAREAPADRLSRSQHADCLRSRGQTRIHLGDLTGAASDTQGALGLFDALPARSDTDWWGTAACHAVLSALAGSPGSGVSPASGPAEAERSRWAFVTSARCATTRPSICSAIAMTSGC
jgi:tetratricopeptide (TPR) repeat protein